MPYRLIKSIDGRRGGLLTFLGLGYLVMGLINLGTPDSLSVDLAFAWLPQHLNANELSLVWIFCGIGMASISLVSSRWPALETWGFIASIISPMVWGLIFVFSTIFGNPYGLRGGAAYLTIAISLVYIAGWPNPVTLHKEKTNDPA